MKIFYPLFFVFFFTEAVSEITGRPDLYAQEGSDVTLLFRLRNYTEPPTYVFWYHGDQMINYDADRKVRIEQDASVHNMESEKEWMLSDRITRVYTCVPYQLIKYLTFYLFIYFIYLLYYTFPS